MPGKCIYLNGFIKNQFKRSAAIGLFRMDKNFVIGDWGLVIGDWGSIPNLQSPVTNHPFTLYFTAVFVL
jgi:hypothetical protein